MSKLTTLKLQHFRNIDQACLEFGEGLNLIVGDNAAGKTALIEALWTLASGRSFRTAKPQQLIQFEHHELVIFCQIVEQQQTLNLGLSRQLDKLTLKLNGETLKTQAQLSVHLPLQLLTPESHRLLEEGPKARRQFMDWGCFHQFKAFLPAWRHYQRALKQRNHALKKQLPAQQIQLWDSPLIEAATEIDEMRSDYIEQLTPFVKEFCQALMPELKSELACQYSAGWPKTMNAQPVDGFADVVKQQFAKDQLNGHTQYGSHRADIKFKFDGQEAILTLSRGQQKLFVCALLLAQACLYQNTSHHSVIMLIDDLPAELDAHHRTTLLKLLDALDIQHILTSTAEDLIPILNSKTARVWHIEKGSIHQTMPTRPG